MAIDYRKRLDAEMWDFIDACERGGGTLPENPTVAELRAAYVRSTATFADPRPAGLKTEDFTLPAGCATVRAYRPATVVDEKVLIVFFHGGGWVLGDLETHDSTCWFFSQNSGLELLAVDYRLAPEAPHPAQYDDCLAAAKWALAKGRSVILMGDSAGGTLAAAVAHTLRGEDVLGQLLVYPYLGAPEDCASMVEHADAPLLSAPLMIEFVKWRGPADASDSSAYPLNDSDFSGLPPTAIFAADCDPIASDSELYADKLRAANVAVEMTMETGLVHGYLRAPNHSTQARLSMDAMARALKQFAQPAQGQTP